MRDCCGCHWMPTELGIVQEGGGDLWRFFATCHPGLEEVVAEELRGPAIRGLQVNTGSAGVTFW